jgi:hypothetical protein
MQRRPPAREIDPMRSTARDLALFRWMDDARAFIVMQRRAHTTPEPSPTIPPESPPVPTPVEIPPIIDPPANVPPAPVHDPPARPPSPLH